MSKTTNNSTAAAVAEAPVESATDTPAFKAWFGNSKIVDDEGNPLRVYHGTDAEFDTFDRSKTQSGPSKFGFWFTPDQSFAEMFGSNQMEVYLRVRNPYRITSGKWNDIRDLHAKDTEWFERWRDRIIKQGHDGLIVTGEKFITSRGMDLSDPSVYAVFEPNQIKSVEATAFDETKESITASVRRYTREQVAQHFRNYAHPGQPDPLLNSSHYELRNVPLTDFDWASVPEGSGYDDDEAALVTEYANRRTPFPPIILEHPDHVEDFGQVVDGNHRVYAAHQRGDKTISAFVPVSEAEKSAAARPLTETPAFKRWFVGSRITDAQGQPVLMYHGTREPFTKVDMRQGAQGLFWLTSDIGALQRGEVGAVSSKTVLRCYVNIKNPAGWDEYEKKSIGELKRDGFDGIKLDDPDGSFNAVVFKGSQVKILPYQPEMEKAAAASGLEAPKWLRDQYKKLNASDDITNSAWKTIEETRTQVAEDNLKLAREKGFEITADDNLVLYHGTRAGDLIRKSGFLRPGSYLSAIKDDSISYAGMAQRKGKAEVFRVEVYPGYGWLQGNGYFSTREPIPVKGATMVTAAKQKPLHLIPRKDYVDGKQNSLNMSFYGKLKAAGNGKLVGKVGDFLEGEEVRRLYAAALNVPIYSLSHFVHDHEKVEREDLAFHGAFGSYQGRPAIFMNPKGKDQLTTFLEEAAHAMRESKGRKDEPQDITKIDFDEYDNLPSEQSAKKMVDHALKLMEKNPEWDHTSEIFKAIERGEEPYTGWEQDYPALAKYKANKIDPPRLDKEAAAPESDAFRQWFGNSTVVDKDGNPRVMFHGTDQEFDTFEQRTGKRGYGGIWEFDVKSPFFFFTPDFDYAGDVAQRKSHRGRVLRVYLKIEHPLDLTTPAGMRKADEIYGILNDHEDESIRAKRDEIANLKEELEKDRAYVPVAFTRYVRYAEDGELQAVSSRLQPGYVTEEVSVAQAKEWNDSDIAEGEENVRYAEKELEEAISVTEAPQSVWQALDEEDAAQKLKAAGYDGIVFKENGGTISYAVSDASQIKSVKNKGTFNAESPSMVASKEAAQSGQFFHGTNAAQAIRDHGFRITKSDEESNSPYIGDNYVDGIYLSRDKADYEEGGELEGAEEVLPVTVNVSKVKVVDGLEGILALHQEYGIDALDPEATEKLTSALRADGYDAVDAGHEFVVLDPSKVSLAEGKTASAPGLIDWTRRGSVSSIAVNDIRRDSSMREFITHVEETSSPSLVTNYNTVIDVHWIDTSDFADLASSDRGEALVDELADVIDAGHPLPPAVLMDGVLADGNHRVSAALKLGSEIVPKVPVILWEDLFSPEGKQASAPKFKYGTVQAELPEDSDAYASILEAREQIDPSDLDGKGLRIGPIHITVRYGIQTDDTSTIEAYLSSLAPMEATLGATSSFPPSPSSDNAAVIIAPVECPELFEINEQLANEGDFMEPTFDYKPHCTVAYVKPEAAEKYTGIKVTAGQMFTIKEVVVITRSKEEKTILLGRVTKVEKTATTVEATKGFIPRTDRRREADYDRFEAWTSAMEFPLRLHRAFDVPPSEIDWDSLGVFWAADIENAQVHFGKRYSEETVVTIEVNEEAVDWEETFLQNVRYAWGETEVTLKAGADVRVVSVTPENDAAQDVIGLVKTADGSTQDRYVRPSSSTPSEPGYLYHATNEDNLHSISEGSMETHKPWDFTEQEVWPDGSTQKRSYFSPNAAACWAFAPENGHSVLIRVKQDSRFKAERGTGDVYTTQPIPAGDIEALTDEGWRPLRDPNSSSVTAGKKEWLGLALAPFLMTHPGNTQPDQKPAGPTNAHPDSWSQTMSKVPKDYQSDDVIDRRHGEKPSVGDKVRDLYLSGEHDYRDSFSDDKGKTEEQVERELKQGPPTAPQKNSSISATAATKLAGKVAYPIHEEAKGRTFYHGTSSQDSADAILQNGIQPREISMPDKANAKGSLAPAKGRIYLTPDISYAAIYGLGGAMFGSTIPERFLNDRNGKLSPYGYIFALEGQDIEGDLIPDEDSIGEFLTSVLTYDRAKSRLEAITRGAKLHWPGETESLDRTVEREKVNPINQPDASRVRWNLRNIGDRVMTDRQRQKIQDGFIDGQAAVGKKIQKYLSASDSKWMLDNGAHAAHLGGVFPTRAWRFKKEDASTIQAKDVLSICEEIPLGALKTAAVYASLKAWFGGSKVVDKQGQPLLVYHGAAQWHDTVKTDTKYSGIGRYFSSSEGVAKAYGPQVYSAYLKLVKPLVVDARDSFYDDIATPKEMSGWTTREIVETDLIAEFAYTHGYDGVIVRNVVEPNAPSITADDYIVFDAAQIRKVEAEGKTAAAEKDITETPAFKTWFGNSKVVDEKGKPLVVYHGTDQHFDIFDPKKAGMGNDRGMRGRGFYFSPNERTAASYGTNVMPVYVSIKNPFKPSDFNSKQGIAERLGIDEDVFEYTEGGEFKVYQPFSGVFTSALKGAGYDGLLYPLRQEVIAFESRQIKSVKGNNGQFDPKDNSITASADLIPDLLNEFMPVLKPGLPRPKIKVVNSIAQYLGACNWRYGLRDGIPFGDENTVIELQKSIVSNEDTLRRVLAHELAHHEDYLVNDAAALKEKGYHTFHMLKKYDSTRGHGPAWQAIAARFNAKYGVDFVTRDSDASYEKAENDIEFYLLLSRLHNKTALYYSWAVRPSPKQKKVIEEELAKGGKLIKSTDAAYMKGAKIGQGWSYKKDPEEKAAMEALFADGKTASAAVAQDPGFQSWFAGSKVVNGDGSPKPVYHGTGADIEHFNYEFTGKGNDQFGSGFYFTDKTSTASGYASARIQSDIPKPGGEQPNVLSVYLAIKKPIYLDHAGETSQPSLTRMQLKKIIEGTPNLDEALENYGEVAREGRSRVLNVAVGIYADTEGLANQLFMIANDFYSNHTETFNKAVNKATGYDGIIVKFDEETHYVAWFPAQIRSAFSGHSFQKAAARPGDLVYHNTKFTSLDAIKREGFDSGSFSNKPIDFGGDVWLAVSKADLPEPQEHQYGDVTAYEPRFEYTSYPDDGDLDQDGTKGVLARHVIPADKIYVVTKRGRIISKLSDYDTATKKTSSDAYQEFRGDLGMRIRDRKTVDLREFDKLTPEDRPLFEKLYREYNRTPRSQEDTTLKVEREKNGIEVVSGPFSVTDDPDEFFYHVTPRRNVAAILSGGFKPSSDHQSMAEGFYREYSRGKVFFCDRGGVSFWEERIAQHIHHETGKAPALSVTRVEKSAVSGMEHDALGTKDSGANCWYANTHVESSPK